MKKTIIILICCILLTGCNTKNTSNISEPSTTTIDPDSGTEVLESDDDINSEISTDKSTFDISSKDIAKIIYGKDVDYYSKNIDGFNIDIYPNEFYRVFCVTSNNDEYPSLVYVYDQYNSGTPKSSETLIAPLLNHFENNDNIANGYMNIGDSLNCIVSCIWVKDSDATEFNITTQISPDTDYFLYTDTDEYKRACREGRYNDILSDVQNYIYNSNPPSYDNAYYIQSVLSPIVESWDHIDVQYDSIEDYAKFTYKDANVINDRVHFVPYALTNEKHIRALIGFYDSDWLFFDRIIISSNDNITISVSSDKIEDIISGSKIYEAYDVSLDDDDITELLSNSIHTIRFKSDNDTYKDYEMTKEEFDALMCISKFQKVRNILSDLLFHFQNG